MTENARTNKPILTTSLIIICVLSAILSLGLIRHLKISEGRFKKERALLVMEKMELKDELDFLKADLKAKGDTIVSLEAEKKGAIQELVRLKKLAEELKTDNEELETLRKRSQELQKELEALRSARLAGETSFGVQLEPIVVTGNTVPGSRAFGQIQGKVFSVNPKKNLIVIDIGQTNGAMEGLQCKIFDSEGQVGTATIIKTRYEISAAFVDTLSPGRTIRDVKEGNRVLAK